MNLHYAFETGLYFLSCLLRIDFANFLYTDNTSANELITKHYVFNSYYLSAIAWLIVICTIITSTFTIIILRKQRKTQKMLRELNEKLDKIQPPSDPGELNTEDTESAE